jgi:hypothetical protein
MDIQSSLVLLHAVMRERTNLLDQIVTIVLAYATTTPLAPIFFSLPNNQTSVPDRRALYITDRIGLDRLSAFPIECGAVNSGIHCAIAVRARGQPILLVVRGKMTSSLAQSTLSLDKERAFSDQGVAGDSEYEWWCYAADLSVPETERWSALHSRYDPLFTDGRFLYRMGATETWRWNVNTRSWQFDRMSAAVLWRPRSPFDERHSISSTPFRLEWCYEGFMMWFPSRERPQWWNPRTGIRGSCTWLFQKLPTIIGFHIHPKKDTSDVVKQLPSTATCYVFSISYVKFGTFVRVSERNLQILTSSSSSSSSSSRELHPTQTQLQLDDTYIANPPLVSGVTQHADLRSFQTFCISGTFDGRVFFSDGHNYIQQSPDRKPWIYHTTTVCTAMGLPPLSTLIASPSTF